MIVYGVRRDGDGILHRLCFAHAVRRAARGEAVDGEANAGSIDDPECGDCRSEA